MQKDQKNSSGTWIGLDSKLAMYSAAAAGFGFIGSAFGATTTATLVNGLETGTYNQGTNIGDTSGTAIILPSSGAPGTGNNAPDGDSAAHLYIKAGETSNGGQDNAAYLFRLGPGGAQPSGGGNGAVANLTVGTVIGATAPATTAYEGDSALTNANPNGGEDENGTDNDLSYVDTTTGTNYTPGDSSPFEFLVGVQGNFGFEFQDPANGNQVEYGYATATVSSSGALTGSYYYDPTGAPITVGETSTAPVPEPTALTLLALGGVGALRRKRS